MKKLRVYIPEGHMTDKQLGVLLAQIAARIEAARKSGTKGDIVFRLKNMEDELTAQANFLLWGHNDG